VHENGKQAPNVAKDDRDTVATPYLFEFEEQRIEFAMGS